MDTMLKQPPSRLRQRRNAAPAKFKQDDGPLMREGERWAQALRTQRQAQLQQDELLRRIPKPLRHLAASAGTTKHRKSSCKIWRIYCAQQGKFTDEQRAASHGARSRACGALRVNAPPMLHAFSTRPAQTLRAPRCDMLSFMATTWPPAATAYHAADRA